jgi:hypothetical protein
MATEPKFSSLSAGIINQKIYKAVAISLLCNSMKNDLFSER